jgi:hypothetical protein
MSSIASKIVSAGEGSSGVVTSSPLNEKISCGKSSGSF